MKRGQAVKPVTVSMSSVRPNLGPAVTIDTDCGLVHSDSWYICNHITWLHESGASINIRILSDRHGQLF